jgi:WD40 repeat protein
VKEPGLKFLNLLFGGLLAGLAAAAGASAANPPVEPMHGFRADHMVLDAAIAGSRVLVGTQSGHVDAFDWRAGEPAGALHTTVKLESGAFPPTVTAVAISPSGALCAVVSSEGLLEVFRVTAEHFGDPILSLRRADLLTARFLNEGRIIVGDRRGELALVDVANGRELYRRQLEYDPIYALAPSPDGRRVAVAFRSSRIQIVAAVSGQTQRVLKGHRDSVYGLAWLDDDTLASASKDKSVLLWNLAQPDHGPRLLYSADHYVTALGVDRREGLLAFPLDEYRVGLVRISDGQVLRSFGGHTGPVQSLIFTGDGERLISAGNDARIFVWDLRSEEEGEVQ